MGMHHLDRSPQIAERVYESRLALSIEETDGSS